ncbi:MAG TPA: GxxExxY protein [Kofleriaceae bacterium]
MSNPKFDQPDKQIDKLSFEVIGAAIEVHRALGAGFGERIYEAALEHELNLRGIAFQSQVPALVRYREHVVGEYRVDLLIDQQIIVQLHAVSSIGEQHISQVHSQLGALELELGLIFNFGRSALRDGGIRRVIRTK